MKKEITIDGVKYRKVEEGIILEAGKWYENNNYGDGGSAFALITTEYVHGKRFEAYGWIDGKCFDNVFVGENLTLNWQPANMQEVEKLLIKEAEKMGFKKGVRFNSPFLACKVNPIIATSDVYFQSGYIQDDEANIIFDFKTGKWAEIIEEKKPLYTNGYGTEYYGGENYYVVTPSHNVKKSIFTFDQDNLEENGELMRDFVGTERECHRWIDENWDKLNK
jgi:hypothetical protein